MFRATTPTHTFTLPIQTDNCKDILVTYSQDDKVVLEKYMDDKVLPDGMTLDDKKVIIVLTQEETNLFTETGKSRKKIAKVQIRVLLESGWAGASAKYDINVEGVINDFVLE